MPVATGKLNEMSNNFFYTCTEPNTNGLTTKWIVLFTKCGRPWTPWQEVLLFFNVVTWLGSMASHIHCHNWKKRSFVAHKCNVTNKWKSFQNDACRGSYMRYWTVKCKLNYIYLEFPMCWHLEIISSLPTHLYLVFQSTASHLHHPCDKHLFSSMLMHVEHIVV